MKWNANSVKITAILVLRSPFVAQLRFHAYSSRYSAVQRNVVVDKFSSSPPRSCSTRLSLYTLCHFAFRFVRCISAYAEIIRAGNCGSQCVMVWLCWLAVGVGSCIHDNGRCDQICIPGYGGRVECRCKPGYRLDIDARSCEGLHCVTTLRLRPDKFHRARRKATSAVFQGRIQKLWPGGLGWAPLPTGRRVWGGQKIIYFLISKWRIFVDSGEQNSVFLLLKALKTHASVALWIPKQI